MKMKCKCYHIKITWTFLVALFLSALSSVVATDKGQWIYHHAQLPFNGHIAACGRLCLVVGASSSSKIYFFDINSSNWTELSYGTQIPRKVMACGNVAFAQTDSLIIGYSALSSQYDTVQYLGSIFSTIPASYGCSSNLILFVTTARMYVFDAFDAQWREFDYNFTTSAYGGTFWVKDDYTVAVFHQISFDMHPQQVSYSGITHSFNQLADGSPGNHQLNHGYVGQFELAGGGYKLIGYSASTNQFSTITISDQTIAGGSTLAPKSAGEVTSYVYDFIKVIQTGVSYQRHFYGYDTKRSVWSDMVFDYSYLQCNFATPVGGGSFGVPWKYNTQGGLISHFIYSGLDGQWQTVTPGLHYVNPSPTGAGGTAYWQGDATQLWGFDVASSRGSTVETIYDQYGNRHQGMNFCALTRWTAASDTMEVYFYNSEQNTWIREFLRKATSDSYTGDAGVFIMRAREPGQTEYEYLLYSPYLHTIVKHQLSGANKWYRATQFLAIAATVDQSVLFDARDGTVYEKNFSFTDNGLTDSAAVYLEPSTNALHGFSALFSQWTTVQQTNAITGLYVTGLIGVAWTTSFSKVYAYNGVHGNWVEKTFVSTDPSGSAYAGDRTGLLVLNGDLYAFSPDIETSTSVGMEEPLIPEVFSLAQNYPNPFNSSSVIKYSIPKSSQVTLNIFNMLGEELETLVNEEKATGTYEITWNAANLPSGVYFYQLKAGEFVQTKKMILLK